MSVSSAQPEMNPTDIAATWTILSTQVEAFIQAWDTTPETTTRPPHPRDFLPEEASGVRQVLLVELLKVDLEYRWLHRGLPKTVAEYLAELPELGETPPADLLYEEFHIRRQSGDTVDPQEYFERYPSRANELRRLLGVEDVNRTTSMFSGRRHAQIAAIEAGMQIDDFDLLTHLGKGAFASVFLARQRSMQRLVALKVSGDRGTEGQTLAQLDHDHIVRVFDQRVLKDQGLRLLYMQYVPGGTLHAVVEAARQIPISERTGRLLLDVIDRGLENRGESRPSDSPIRQRLAGSRWPEVVCWLGARLARALDYAHQHGVLHRDIKPANVLLTADGSPKLADFNISFSSELSGATPAAYFGGSLAYMSPEQLEACNPAHERKPESLDGRSDLYSLGVMLWELMIGSRPFTDEQLSTGWGGTLERMTARRRAGIDPELLAQISSQGLPGMDLVLSRCLASEPDDRYSTGAELARDLELCLQPQTQRLLAPASQFSWRQLARRFPLSSIVAMAFVPNVAMAVFNYVYNEQQIIRPLFEKQPAAYDVFFRVQATVNAIAFPLGLGLAAYLTRGVARAMRSPSYRRELSFEELQALRKRTLRLGHFAAIIGTVLWFLAGLAYPVAIHLGLGGVPGWVYPHFLASMTLCGLVAAAYPFLTVTFLALRSFYPPLIRLDSIRAADLEQLIRLGRLSWLYLLLAAFVPMLAVGTLVLTGSTAQFALRILCGLGLAGLLLAFALVRTIQSDLAALAPAVSLPGTSAETTSESFGHF